MVGFLIQHENRWPLSVGLLYVEVTHIMRGVLHLTTIDASVQSARNNMYVMLRLLRTIDNVARIVSSIIDAAKCRLRRTFYLCRFIVSTMRINNTANMMSVTSRASIAMTAIGFDEPRNNCDDSRLARDYAIKHDRWSAMMLR